MGGWERSWDAERFILFQIVILQRACHVTEFQVIRCRIRKRLDAWDAGQHRILVDEIYCTYDQYLPTAHRDKSKDQQENTFYSLVLRGELQTAVLWRTEQERGGVMQPRKVCTNIGEPFLDMLQAKHHDARTPSTSSIYTYPGQHLGLVPFNLVEETVI